MQNSHFNNRTLALTYLPDLAQPYDLEPIFTEFGHQALSSLAHFVPFYEVSSGMLSGMGTKSHN